MCALKWRPCVIKYVYDSSHMMVWSHPVTAVVGKPVFYIVVGSYLEIVSVVQISGRWCNTLNSVIRCRLIALQNRETYRTVEDTPTSSIDDHSNRSDNEWLLEKHRDENYEGNVVNQDGHTQARRIVWKLQNNSFDWNFTFPKDPTVDIVHDNNLHT